MFFFFWNWNFGVEIVEGPSRIFINAAVATGEEGARVK